MEKPRVKVQIFGTKTGKFRAKVRPGVAPQYEVTIGGYSWNNNIGNCRRHEKEILTSLIIFFNRLRQEYNTVMLKDYRDREERGEITNVTRR